MTGGSMLSLRFDDGPATERVTMDPVSLRVSFDVIAVVNLVDASLEDDVER
jgi:hypothetical protein